MIVRCCPRCFSLRIRRAQPQSPFEVFLLPLVLLRPYRCEKCKRRYYGSAFAKRLATPDETAPGVASKLAETAAPAARHR